jgi:hypothetical protein
MARRQKKGRHTMRICKIVNTPVALETLTKHADVSKYSSPAPQTNGSCRLRPRTAAQLVELSRRVAHYAALQQCAGLDSLRRLRITWGCWKRAKANAIEDAPFALRLESRFGPGAAYEAGLSCGMPDRPKPEYCIRRVREAVEAGLPRDLELLCRAWLAQQVSA